MFHALFRRAEVAIEHSIGQIAIRLLVATPFLIAAGFATAALSLRLAREYGQETANLLLAGLFLLVGLLIGIVAALQAPAMPAPEAAAAGEGPSDHPRPTDNTDLSSADRELLMAALASVAPVAIPVLAQRLLRNLPLIAAVGAAVFVMTRPTPNAGHAAAAE